MRTGLKEKRIFSDVVLVPKSEVLRIRQEIIKHQKKKPPIRKRLVFDTVLPDERIKKAVEKIWPSEQLRIKTTKPVKDIIPIKPHVILEKTVATTAAPSLLKKSLILFLELVFVALIIYNALSLYFESEGLIEKLNNLALASKARIARAQESISSFDREASTTEIEKAGIHFLSIKSELLSLGEYNYLLPNHPLLQDDLARGQNMVELGLLIKDVNLEINFLLDALTANNEGNLKERVRSLEPSVSRLKSRVNRADIILKNNEEIKKSLGPETETKIENIINKSKIELEEAEKVLNIFPLILGTAGNSHYLVLFLNNAEMRPGGGFPGTYGLVGFKDNNFSELKIENIYNLDRLKRDEIDKINLKAKYLANDPKILAALPKEFYLSEPMNEITKNGYFRLFSSNWNLDFRQNAKRAVYLYNNFYQQTSVSGVIALTPDAVEEIMGIIGPIEMEQYSVEINQQNFREIIEYKVEVDNPYRKEKKWEVDPKQILADFGPILLDRIKNAELNKKIKIFGVLANAGRAKQIMLYHSDNRIQQVINELGLSGEIRESESDAIGIFQSNINGMKNGRKIDCSLGFKSQVSSLGFAMDELTLTMINNENEPRLLHGKEESYLEIILPLGSRLREAKIEGKDFIGRIDYFQESEHTILGFMVELEPGEAKNIVLKYQAPLKEYKEKGYNLNLIKQPGAKTIPINGEIFFEDNNELSLNPLIIREVLDKDKIIRPKV